MRNVDGYAINYLNIPSQTLMENAGRACAKEISERLNVLNKRVLIICGKGNNAGDGFVIARYLSNYGAKVEVLLTMGKTFSKEAEKVFSLIPNDVKIFQEINKKKEYDIFIDCVFGTGFRGSLPDNIKAIFDFANSATGYKVAVDNPSGLSENNIEGVFKADLTIDIQLFKIHQFIYPMANFCGEVVSCDIGIPKEAINAEKSNISLIDKKNLQETIKKRDDNSHKGTYGTLLSFCGSRNMPGACVLSGKAALRCGVGLLKTFTPSSIHRIIASHLIESVNYSLTEDEKGTINFDLAKDLILEEIKSADCILIGCGLSKTNNALKLLKFVLENAYCPIVIDADGINLLAENIYLLNDCKTKVILTPHPGEMARLLNVSVSDVQSERLNKVMEFTSKYKNIVLVLKGAGTIISDGKDICINNTGNPGMARGGSGDVLAGMIASFVTQKYDLLDSCSMAVYMHGLCGDFVAKEKSQYGMIPSDMIEKIPEIFKFIIH